MMIWHFLHIFFDIFPEIILGAGPFCVFKSMGVGSQSGKLLFKSASDGKNIKNIDDTTLLCIRDQMIFDASIPNGEVAVGCGTSLCCSTFFIAQSLEEGGAYGKRGINVPILGMCDICTKTNINCGIFQRGIIIGSVGSIIYKSIGGLYDASQNNIIGSKYSCLGGSSQYANNRYSSIITSCGSSIATKNYLDSSHNTIIGSQYSKVLLSNQSTIIGGYQNLINYYYSGLLLCASSRNFIGSGQKNSIYNLKLLTGCSPDADNQGFVALNSVLSGCQNKIYGTIASSIASGKKNIIDSCTKVTNFGNVNKRSSSNFIGSGRYNEISSYSKENKEHYCGSQQSIISGSENSVRNSSNSSILNGEKNYIGVYYSYTNAGCANEGVTILNGYKNCIIQSPNSSIINGYLNYIGYKKINPGTPTSNNVIANGYKNALKLSCNSAILNGCLNSISSSFESSILSGDCNCINSSKTSTILHGTLSYINSSKNSTIDSSRSCIFETTNSTIIGGRNHFIKISTSTESKNNVILSNYKSRICSKVPPSKSTNFNINQSSIIGGSNNIIETTVTMNSVGILGGYLNTVRRSAYSGILGGYKNILGATSSSYSTPSVFGSVIIGGEKNSIKIGTKDQAVKDYRSCGSLIVGGYGNCFVCECVGNFNVIIGGCKLQGLVIDSNGSGKVFEGLAQTENFSLRGNMYVNDLSGNRCKGISSLNINSSQIITSICVVKGIIITMSYS